MKTNKRNERNPEILRMYQEDGISIKNIAKDQGLTRQAIDNIIKKLEQEKANKIKQDILESERLIKYHTEKLEKLQKLPPNK